MNFDMDLQMILWGDETSQISEEYSDGGETAWSPSSAYSDQENVPSNNYSTTGDNLPRKPRNPVKRVQQRSAANQRERKRMKTINDAFEGLKDRIPLGTKDRKLSKVDTLRLAISYIHHLSDMVNMVGGPEGAGQSSQDQAEQKIIIRCHNTGYPEYPEYPEYGVDACGEYPLYGHSLSWVDNKQPQIGVNKRLVAKVWVPESVDPSTSTIEHCQMPL